MSDDTPKLNKLLSNSSNNTEPDTEPEAESGLETESEKSECINNSCSIKCIKQLIEHIKGKKRKLDLFRKILEIKYNRYPSELESFLKIDVYASCKDPIKEMFFFMKHGDKIPIHKLGIQYGRDNDYIQWKQEQT